MKNSLTNAIEMYRLSDVPAKASGNVPLTGLYPPWLYDKIVAHAKHKGVSVADVLRWMAVAFFQVEEAKHD